jgi:quinoprotein glucose dehydrogenase
VVSSTGLIFLAGADAKIRAYDADTGKVLWTATLPGQSRGIPAMYELNGRQYLIVNASNAQGPAGSGAEQPRGYVAFALSEKADASR